MTTDMRSKLNSIERIKKKELFAKARPAEGVKRGDLLKGKIYNVTEDGAFVMTDENFIGFIHNLEQPHPLKIGMAVEGRVTYVRPDGRVNLSLRLQKELARVADAERILEYLKKRGGSMPFNDDSPPEAIKEKFGISKSAFKRALGKLYKDELIFESDGWVTLKKEESDDVR